MIRVNRPGMAHLGECIKSFLIVSLLILCLTILLQGALVAKRPLERCCRHNFLGLKLTIIRNTQELRADMMLEFLHSTMSTASRVFYAPPYAVLRKIFGPSCTHWPFHALEQCLLSSYFGTGDSDF